jgi:DNA invertase Pin-like site-specific DNA recombinase
MIGHNKKKKYVRLWSPNRPERPETDPIHIEIMKLLQSDPRSVWEIADNSGLSTSTIYNWQNHKTKRPSSVSLQMAAKFLGRKIRLE